MFVYAHAACINAGTIRMPALFKELSSLLWWSITPSSSSYTPVLVCCVRVSCTSRCTPKACNRQCRAKQATKHKPCATKAKFGPKALHSAKILIGGIFPSGAPKAAPTVLLLACSGLVTKTCKQTNTKLSQAPNRRETQALQLAEPDTPNTQITIRRYC